MSLNKGTLIQGEKGVLHKHEMYDEIGIVIKELESYIVRNDWK